MQVLSASEVSARQLPDPSPTRWTAVIPAAGRGSRLNYDKPKILYPVAGRPILDHLIDLLEPVCAQLIFVLSPAGAPLISPHVAERLGGRAAIAIQTEPRGMADAIAQAVPHLTTPNTLVIWGDQISIRPQTLRTLQQLHEHTPGATFSLPLVNREEPYIHFARAANGTLDHVLKRREGDPMPEHGDADCGLFAFATNRLQTVFSEVEAEGKTIVGGTNEWDLHPMLPRFETGATSVNAFMLESIEETVGVNDEADAHFLEEHLTVAAK